MPLLPIPADLGQGGANIGDGNPKLAAILQGLTDAVVALQNAPAPSGKSTKVFFANGRNGAGSITLNNAIFGGGTVPAAAVGDKVLAVIAFGVGGGFVTDYSPGVGGSGNYENTITVAGHIQQTTPADHHLDHNFIILQTP